MADDLSMMRSADALRDGERTSFGVVRILSERGGSPGEEREYKSGDEALVEAGLAEWVIAPVHTPAAGRRLDHDAQSAPTPLSGVEAYPPAEPTTAARRAEARQTGSVAAHADAGLGETLASRRAEVASAGADDGGDAARQAALGGLGARSGPISAPSELPADKQQAAAASPDEGGTGSHRSGAKAK